MTGINGFGNSNAWNYSNNNNLNVRKVVNDNLNDRVEVGNFNTDDYTPSTLGKSFSDYLNEYMEKRFGKDWQTNCSTITPNGFAEQSGFMSVVYASYKWLTDKIFG
jgi:hypothetical protein